MGPAVGQRFQFRMQALQHAFDISSNVAVREADRRVPALGVQVITNRISFGVVRIPVYLHNQRFLGAEEVDDTIADHVLAAELVTPQL